VAIDFGFARDDGFDGFPAQPRRRATGRPPAPRVGGSTGQRLGTRPDPGSCPADWLDNAAPDVRPARIPQVPQQRQPLAEIPAAPVAWPDGWAVGGGHAGHDPFGDPVLLRGYEITAAIRQGASGGAYRGVDLSTCRTVFIKEAAPGELPQEHELLRRLHDREPGLAPEPLAQFAESGRDYLVTELVPGQALTAWAAGAAAASYYDQCRALLRQVSAAAVRMRRHGVLPLAFEPADVLVAADGRARLTGFGPIARADGTAADLFGLFRLARFLLRPNAQDADWAPGNLDVLHAAIERAAPVPDDLWELACAGDLP
jgi:hypothetical protein